jgi:hypothetical protein
LLTFADKVKKVIHYKKEGLSNKEIAEKLFIAKPYVNKLWALRRLHPRLMEMLEERKLSGSRAEVLARLSLEEQEEEYKKLAGIAETDSDKEILRKLVLDGVVGVNLSRMIMEMSASQRRRALIFLSDPSSPLDDSDDEIQEKRRELEMLNREIGYKKNSITFMNYTRDALKPLIRAEDSIRELARGGVDRVFLLELTEWLGLLRRIEEIIRNAMATVQIYDAEAKISEKTIEGSNVLCQQVVLCPSIS